MEEYVNDADLFRFNSFLKGPVGGVYHEIGPDLPSLEDLFPENVYYAILFKRNPHSVVGHWVVLIKFSDTVFEYFDCLGDPVPQPVLQRLEEYGLMHNVQPQLHRSSRSLMTRDGIICGKWVMFRLCLPNSLAKFNAFFDTLLGKRSKLKPDDIVNFVINIPYDVKNSP
jgi:hypothetical protein